MGERGLRPSLQDNLIGFVPVGAVAFLVLNGGPVGSSEYLGLSWLVTTADAKFYPPAADDIQHRCLFRHTDRMPPGQYIGHLPEPNTLCLDSDRRLSNQRVGTELRSFRHEVVLGHKPMVIP